jgi:hypothetical protein
VFAPLELELLELLELELPPELEPLELELLLELESLPELELLLATVDGWEMTGGVAAAAVPLVLPEELLASLQAASNRKITQCATRVSVMTFTVEDSAVRNGWVGSHSGKAATCRQSDCATRRVSKQRLGPACLSMRTSSF